MVFSEVIERYREYGSRIAISWGSFTFSYDWLVEKIEYYLNEFPKHQIESGNVVEIMGDYTPVSIALLLALISKGCITVPIARQTIMKAPKFREIAEVEHIISVDENEHVSYQKTNLVAKNPLIIELKKNKRAGLILFSSGSTGEPKAALHDWNNLLDRYQKKVNSRKVLIFLLFDHIGGLNTLMHTLASGGCAVIPEARTPQSVCFAIESQKAELLPTTPTFLNMILHSAAHQKYDLSSLKIITYGTEVMPKPLLKQYNMLYPQIKLIQTYGLSELGIFSTESESSSSGFIKFKQNADKIRVNEGMLEIKTKMQMLGYLNRPSPFTEDGWFKTGDLVEIQGDYIKILGRASEIINVGGLKVYPVQVEEVIKQMDNIRDVLVQAGSSPITGQIVKAIIVLKQPEDYFDFRKRMASFCKDKLENFEIPQQIEFAKEMKYTSRFKKLRS